MNHGVYILACDSAVELTTAFLNSFREHNPNIPICWLPFSDNHAALDRLTQRYSGVTKWDNPELLRQCDIISRNFHSAVQGHYRKLACWEGPFEQFLYLDVDTVVLSDLTFVFELLGRHQALVSQSHGRVDNVWRDSIYSTGALTRSQIAFAANTGFIGSHRGLLTLSKRQDDLTEAVKLRQHMILKTKEQPLLNYLLVRCAENLSSLDLLSTEPLLYPRVRRELWAGTKGRKFHYGRCIDRGPSPLLVHWAGLWQPRFFDRCVPRKGMPYRALWEYYRYLDGPEGR